jgi:hypothetical protein
MDWIGSDHVGTPTDKQTTIEGLCFLLRGQWREDVGECGNGRSVPFSVQDIHGKLGVEEGLEIGL